MPNFTSSIDTEARQPLKRETGPAPLHCPKCQGTFFTQLACQQFVEDHGVVLGQAVPAQGQAVFYLLACVKCSKLELVEPRLIRQARDMVNSKYDEFVNELTSEPKSPQPPKPTGFQVEKI